MKRPEKENYKPFDLTGDEAIAKWMIDYSCAQDNYLNHLESKLEKRDLVDIQIRNNTKELEAKVIKLLFKLEKERISKENLQQMLIDNHLISLT